MIHSISPYLRRFPLACKDWSLDVAFTQSPPHQAHGVFGELQHRNYGFGGSPFSCHISGRKERIFAALDRDPNIDIDIG